jgi:outer membrane lipoprotein SlyB
LIRKSKYLGPEGPPINPKTGKPYGRGTKAYKAWQLTSTAAYGPGTYDPNSLLGRFKNSKFYNNFLAPNTALAGPMQRGMSKLNVARHIQNMRLFAGESRKSRLGAMFLGNENRKGFQGSATGTMGTMLGLGLLAESGMVSEEAKGFLSAGAMVGMMNPLAGLAIGLGGTALTAKTVAGGAVAGAGAGAAIGSMIAPGFGTAAGAIIGAAVGGIMGRVNKIKEEKKQAKEAFEAVFDRIITDNLTTIQREMMASGGVGKSQIAKAASKGGRIAQQQDVILDMFRSGASGTEMTDYLTKNSQLYGLTPDDVKKMKKRPEETVKVIKKVEERQTAMNALTDIYSKRLKELTMMTGKSEQEVELLAMELGVNLYDATADFNDIVQKLGVSVVQTREQLKGMQMDIALKGLEDFKKKMNLIADPEIIDEQARSFRDLYDSVDGNISDSDFSEFLYSFTPNMFNYVGGALQGLIEIQRMFGMNGSEFGRKEGDITSPFFGMEKLFQSSPVGVAYQDMVDKQIDEGTRRLASQVNAQLFQSKSADRFQIDANKLGTAISGLDADAAKQLISDIEAGTLFNQVDIDTLTRDQFVSMLGKYGIRESQLGIRAVQDNDELTISLDSLPDELKTTYTTIIDMFGTFFDTRDSTKPEWMTDEFIKFVAANSDTSSPRGKGIGDTTASRLSQTMSRHAALDGALTGNRTVTSAYRTYGLGSINSDHVTGRAYDLVGQNLGSYQRLVRNSGGFAEFHGRNAGRHLHVVPGPGPYGDAVSPRIMAPVATPSGESGGGNGITISQVIYGNTNASEVADQAVRKMKLALENERQRR